MKALALGCRGSRDKPGAWKCKGPALNPDFGVHWLCALKHTYPFKPLPKWQEDNTSLIKGKHSPFKVSSMEVDSRYNINLEWNSGFLKSLRCLKWKGSSFAFVINMDLCVGLFCYWRWNLGALKLWTTEFSSVLFPLKGVFWEWFTNLPDWLWTHSVAQTGLGFDSPALVLQVVGTTEVALPKPAEL